MGMRMSIHGRATNFLVHLHEGRGPGFGELPRPISAGTGFQPSVRQKDGLEEIDNTFRVRSLRLTECQQDNTKAAHVADRTSMFHVMEALSQAKENTIRGVTSVRVEKNWGDL